MTTATRSTETKNSKITIKITRSVTDKTAYSDGYNTKIGREVAEYFDIALHSKEYGFTKRTSGKRNDYGMPKIDQDAPAGAVGRMGNQVWLSREVYDIIIGMMDELEVEVPKTDEQNQIEAEEVERKRIGQENMDRMSKEHAARQRHPGWCEKCQSYCYGDCEA